MTVLDAIRPASNDGSAASPDRSDFPSAGPPARGWIQAPITRVSYAAIASAPLRSVGNYSTRESGVANPAQNEVTQLQIAAAVSFWSFEDSLPED